MNDLTSMVEESYSTESIGCHMKLLSNLHRFQRWDWFQLLKASCKTPKFCWDSRSLLVSFALTRSYYMSFESSVHRDAVHYDSFMAIFRSSFLNKKSIVAINSKQYIKLSFISIVCNNTVEARALHHLFCKDQVIYLHYWQLHVCKKPLI